jgi:hypothetical protein
VDQQDPLALEEGGRIPRPARLEQRLERPQRTAARADAAGRGSATTSNAISRG